MELRILNKHYSGNIYVYMYTFICASKIATPLNEEPFLGQIYIHIYIYICIYVYDNI
jgi:hypothetical protein